MKVVKGQKMVNFALNDFLDHHSIDRNIFGLRTLSCVPLNCVEEVMHFHTSQLKNRRVKIEKDISRSLMNPVRTDPDRIQ